MSLREYAVALSRTRDRLGALSAGDAQLQASFTLSYDAIPSSAKSLFRRLSVIPGHAIDPRVSGVLLDDAEQGRTALEELLEAHLIERTVGDRFRLHDLLREFASEKFIEQEDAEERRAVVLNVASWYEREATRLGEILNPSDISQSGANDDNRDAEIAEAARWFEYELDALTSLAEQAYESEAWGLTWSIVNALGSFLSITSRWAEWETVLSLALKAARRMNDPQAAAMTLANVGVVQMKQHRLADAEEAVKEALTLHEQSGDKRGKARVLATLAGLARSEARLDEARDLLFDALVLYREGSDVQGEARTIGDLANLEPEEGEALRLHRESLGLFEQIGDPWGAAKESWQVANLLISAGRVGEAKELLVRARELFASLSDEIGVAGATESLGLAHFIAGDLEQAERFLRDGLERALVVGDSDDQARVRSLLADVLQQRGELDDAFAEHTRALQDFEKAGNLQGIGHSHARRGLVHVQSGSEQMALGDFESAVAAFRSIGDAENLRQALWNLANVYELQGRVEDALRARAEAQSLISGDDLSGPISE